MCSNAIREYKILAKISEFTVHVIPHRASDKTHQIDKKNYPVFDYYFQCNRKDERRCIEMLSLFYKMCV